MAIQTFVRRGQKIAVVVGPTPGEEKWDTTEMNTVSDTHCHEVYKGRKLESTCFQMQLESPRFETSRVGSQISFFSELIGSPMVQVLVCWLILLTEPMLLYMRIPGSTLYEFLCAIRNGWDAQLRMSCFLAFFASLLLSLYCGHEFEKVKNCYSKKSAEKTYILASLMLLVVGAALSMVNIQLQMLAPSSMWNPLLWGTYKVYSPFESTEALDGLCVDYRNAKNIAREPLCLSEQSWSVLSAGALSSTNEDDVASVLKGVDYAQNSGGLIVNVMCRDCVEFVPALIQNVNNLMPFFPTLSVVIFENDSKDDSRNSIKQWAKDAKGYDVDLIECEEALDCRIGDSHRDDTIDFEDYVSSSAVGKMGVYRQRIVDYILSNRKYDNYSHMIVTDVDLAVSLSPLGLLHVLGEVPNNPVASSGRQTFPGSLGTLVPPYDFSALRGANTEESKGLQNITDLFCSLEPPGSRWRNACHAMSPGHMALNLQLDRGTQDIYRVESAFNGAVLYPMKRIRDVGAKYDSGEDGQRCEHVGFHLSLRTPMFVDRKWTFHISPSNPGGPTGGRAYRNIVRIMSTPKLFFPVFGQGVTAGLLFLFSSIRIGVHIFYPLLFGGIWAGKRTKSLPLVQTKAFKL